MRETASVPHAHERQTATHAGDSEAPEQHTHAEAVPLARAAESQHGTAQGVDPVAASVQLLQDPAFAAAEAAVRQQLQGLHNNLAAAPPGAAHEATSPRNVASGASAHAHALHSDGVTAWPGAHADQVPKWQQEPPAAFPFVPAPATRDFTSVRLIDSPSAAFAHLQEVEGGRAATPQDQYRAEQFQALEAMLQEDIVAQAGATKGHDSAHAVQHGDAGAPRAAQSAGAEDPHHWQLGAQLQELLLSQLRGTEARKATPSAAPATDVPPQPAAAGASDQADVLAHGTASTRTEAQPPASADQQDGAAATAPAAKPAEPAPLAARLHKSFARARLCLQAGLLDSGLHVCRTCSAYTVAHTEHRC